MAAASRAYGAPSLPRQVLCRAIFGIGCALLVVAGCSPPSSSSGKSLPRSFLWIDDWFCRGTADHDETILPPSEAHRLAANPFGISLRNLGSLASEAARELAACRGFLNFCALRTLSPAAAGELAEHGEDLRLERLEALPADTARALARHAGAIHLNGLRSIDRATAEALSAHDGFLALNGLEATDDGVIEALARHRGHLCLNGVDSLSAEAAEAIAKRTEKVSLHGLSSLSYEAARILVGTLQHRFVDLPEWLSGPVVLPVAHGSRAGHESSRMTTAFTPFVVSFTLAGE
jgi:hypothetical protein